MASSPLTEAVNTHLEHVEDLVATEGLPGLKRTFAYLSRLVNTLAGHTDSPVNVSVKWDGAPALFAGLDPADGRFFVAKKSLFNKRGPEVYKSPQEIRQHLSGDLAEKFLTALAVLQPLGWTAAIGIFQGDLLFTRGDLKKEQIDGAPHLVFQPNTIAYAVPVGSVLASVITRARMGIAWHTLYTGPSLQQLTAQFGQRLVHRLTSSPAVWMVDATYEDVSGSATLTAAETEAARSLLRTAAQHLFAIPPAIWTLLATEPKIGLLLRRFFVKRSKENARARLVVPMWYAVLDEFGAGPAIQAKIRSAPPPAWEALFLCIQALQDVKHQVVQKLHANADIATFYRTAGRLHPTDPEGYVAVDHIGRAVKLVDRMAFSRLNADPAITKGWERRP